MEESEMGRRSCRTIDNKGILYKKELRLLKYCANERRLEFRGRIINK